MIFPVIELVDRYSIAKLKNQKTDGANHTEFEFYHQQLKNIDSDLSKIEPELEQLYQIHEQIWNLESQLKSGKESELSLEEIGRRAISIRDLNNQRIRLKNLMAEKLDCKIKEIKKDHLSE